MTSDQDQSGEREQGARRTDADFLKMTREELLTEATELRAEAGAPLDRLAELFTKARAAGPIDEDGDELRFLSDMTRFAYWVDIGPPDPGRVALAAVEWEGREDDECLLLPVQEVERAARWMSQYLNSLAWACSYLMTTSSHEETP